MYNVNVKFTVKSYMSEFLIAVHVLIYLRHKNEAINSEALASNICVNPVRVRTVMKEFIKNNLIKTTKGKKGGYSLNKNLEDITLLEVSKILNYDFLHNNWYTGNKDSKCIISANIEEYFRNLISMINIDIEDDIIERGNNEKL